MLAIREIVETDIPELTKIRVSVRENSMSREEMAASNITPETTAEKLRTYCKGWIAEYEGQAVGFSIADSKTNSIWALFLYEQYERRGIGKRLLGLANARLWEMGAEQIWLRTMPNTRADGFYNYLGWTRSDTNEYGEVRFTLDRPLDR